VVSPFALHNPTVTEHCQTRKLTDNVDDDLLSLEGAAIIVDALVSDEPVDVNIQYPPGAFDVFGRAATPSAPPGLGPPLPHSHPSPAVSYSSLLGPGGSQTPPVALPTISAKPAAANASTPIGSKKATASSAPEAKKNIKLLAVESGLSKDIAKAKSQKTLQDEDFPALGTPKVPQPSVTPIAPPKLNSGKAAPSPSKNGAEKAAEKEKSVPTQAATSVVKVETRAAQKRPTPGILNIAAATKASQTKTVDPHSAVDKLSAEKDSAFPALPTPPTGSVSSPAARAAPKTLRVVPTPKTDVPPPITGSGAAALPTPPVRSAAIVAIRPETPVSELISDSASIISASISASRTNSPPPSKVGSAPVRTTTKSQQRKQRKDALKKDTVIISAPAPKPEPEVEIAPILGRKKKQKKEKEKPMSHSATPAASRPQTPLPHALPPPPIKEVKEAREETSAYRSTANETTMLTEDATLHKARHADSKGKHVDGSRLSDQSSTPRSLPTPAMVLQRLREEGLVPDSLDDFAFFKPTSWQSDKLRSDVLANGSGEHAGKNSITPTKSIVTEQDQALLLAGKPVRKVIDGVRVLLTPNGDCIRNLSDVEEEHFLALQRSIAEQAGSPAVFVSSRHEASTGFSLIKGRAVPNGPPSYFPPAPGTYPTDPMSKFQREEAIYYINQYVLPRLNLNARDVSFPHSKLNTQWSPDAKNGAAANLLAPWMYGAKGPQYGNDAAAPELNYPGPVGSFADTVDPTLEAYFDVQTEAMTDPTPIPPPMDEMIPALPGYKDNHAAAPNMGQSGPFAGVPLMSYEDAEQALSLARKETEKLEKALSQIMRKNRRVEPPRVDHGWRRALTSWRPAADGEQSTGPGRYRGRAIWGCPPYCA
jgi:CCR4-NOT transcription complex subunit 4